MGPSMTALCATLQFVRKGSNEWHDDTIVPLNSA